MKIEDVESFQEFDNLLNELASKIGLDEHWIKNLIHSFLLMMMFVHAERKGDFLLHHEVCKMIPPCFLLHPT